MDFLKHYHENVVRYDLINKFFYKNVDNTPKLKFVSLYFNFKRYELKSLISALVALELISSQKGSLVKSKSANISLRIRKGHPTSCRVILRKKKMNQVLSKILNKIIISNRIPVRNFMKINTISFTIKNVLIFEELEKNYRFFRHLDFLRVDIVTTAKNHSEFITLLKAYKITL